jgi:low affinity Fe/Cu permease
MANIFHRFALRATHLVGTSSAFFAALFIVIAWAVTGPLFHYSDGWQLVINTATTIVTFLMVFVIQHSQNRDNAAMHAKLDRILKGSR